MLYKRLPILRWLPQWVFSYLQKTLQQILTVFIFFRYNSTDAVGDLVAGLTVGLTVIPQALAYSGIAGLPAAVNTYIYIYF